VVIRIAIGLLGLYALILAIVVVQNRRGGGGTDAAGRGLATAYIAIGLMLWLGMAALTALGVWTRVGFLVYTPFIPLLFPVLLLGEGVLRLFGRLQSKPRQLERAVRAGNAPRVKELLAETPVGDGRALLEGAVSGRYGRDVVVLLLDAGASPNHPALLAKVLQSTTTSLEPFLKHGADPNTILPSGDPILFAALEEGWSANVLALLEAGVDLKVRDREGWTPLLAHATGRRGFGPRNWVGVHDLLVRGADPSVPGPDGTTLASLFAKTQPFEIHPDRLEDLRKRING
jgi:hypothetical protein